MDRENDLETQLESQETEVWNMNDETQLSLPIVVYSWPEGELRGTLVREQVHRLVQARQEAQGERGGA
jgi:hypothetical protein